MSDRSCPVTIEPGHDYRPGAMMSDEVKKAICLCVFTATMVVAWCFDAYLEYKEVFTLEQTKGVDLPGSQEPEIGRTEGERTLRQGVTPCAMSLSSLS